MQLQQGRSYQIWSDQVGSACARTLYPMGFWEHAPPGKFWNLGAMRLLLRPLLGQYDASRRPNNRVLHEYHSAHCIVHQWCRLSDPVCLSAKSHTLRRKLTRLIVRTESCWKTHGTVLLHCSPFHKFQHGTYVLQGVAWDSAKQWC